jgi:MATE family multidrug resistance protein
MFSRPRLAQLVTESRSTLVLALPIIVGQLLTVIMNVIDTVLAGRLGTDVLAAVAMGYQIWVLALLIVIGLMLAVTPAVAQLDGAGRRDAVGAVFRQALWLAVALGVTLFAGVRGGEPLFRLVGVAPEIVPYAREFLDGISWGAPALALFFACKHTSEGLSITRPTMYFSLLGVVVLLPAAYVLMYGVFGLPALRAYGAGLAHAIALWAQALGFVLYMLWRRHYAAAALFAHFEPPNLRALVALLRIGIPMGTAIFMEGSLFVATALMMGSLGTVAAGAHAIAINVASLAFMVPLGIALATTVRVGNAVGRREPDGIVWAALAGLTLVLMSQLLLAGGMLSFAQPIVALYTADAAVAALAALLLWYAALFQFSDGIQALANGALRGLKDTAIPALITILAYWAVGMSVAWWLGLGVGSAVSRESTLAALGLQRGQGASGLWTGLIVGLTVAAIGLSIRFIARVRRYRREGIPEVLAADGAAAGGS